MTPASSPCNQVVPVTPASCVDLVPRSNQITPDTIDGLILGFNQATPSVCDALALGPSQIDSVISPELSLISGPTNEAVSIDPIDLAPGHRQVVPIVPTASTPGPSQVNTTASYLGGLIKNAGVEDIPAAHHCLADMAHFADTSLCRRNWLGPRLSRLFDAQLAFVVGYSDFC